MKKNFTLVFFLLCSLMANSQTYFSKSYGVLSDTLDLQQAIATKDGGYLVAANNQSGNPEFLIMRTDKDGVPLWTFRYGTDSLEEIAGITETTDGGFVFTGGYYPADNEDVFVGKLNSSGTIQWLVTVPTNDDDYPKGISATADSGSLIVGTSYALGTNSIQSAFIIKLDKNGSLVWQQVIEGGNTQQLMDVVATADGGALAVGQQFKTGVQPATSLDAVLYKFTADGSVDWMKKYRTAGAEIIYGLDATADGGSVFAGVGPNANAAYKSDIIVCRTDSNGQVLWQNRYGTAEYEKAWDVAVVQDGSIFVAGEVNITDSATEKRVGCLLHISPTGNLISNILVGDTSAPARAMSVCEAPGGLLIGLSTFGYGLNWGGMALFHTNLNGSIDTACSFPAWTLTQSAYTTQDTVIQLYSQPIALDVASFTQTSTVLDVTTQCSSPVILGLKPLSQNSAISIYPNPAFSQLSINTNGAAIQQITIFDIAGQVVKQISNPAGNHINVEELNKGVYFTSIKTTQGSFNVKWVKM